jgi:dienelactone hydrolase
MLGQAKGIGSMAPGIHSPKTYIGDDKSPGSGPYPAVYPYLTDDSLPDHTIYAPKSPPKDIKLPAIIFGNGGCMNAGSMYQNILREIASHGFIVLANGAPGKAGGGFSLAKQTSMKSMTESLNWIVSGGANAKFGQIDASKIAAAGQSCGGLEAYAASYHEDRIKQTILMNSGVIDEANVYLLAELKAPVALFIGGPKDVAYLNVSVPSL